MTVSGEDGFLSRWSRRKREEKEAPEGRAPPEAIREDAAAPQDAAEEAAPADLDPGLTEEELAALPKVEEMTADTDLKLFMRRGVPAELRRAAMRRMWSLNPTISTYLDVARDYAYDWNTPGGVPGHGGPLNLEEVARTVDRFLRRRSDEPPAEPNAHPVEEVPPEEVAEAAPALDSPPDRPVAPPAPGGAEDRVPASDPTLGEAAGSDDGAGENSSTPKPAPRRHGGAVPR